jgi:hypothetical protein
VSSQDLGTWFDNSGFHGNGSNLVNVPAASLVGYTVGTLPGDAAQGAVAFVTDANAPAYLTPIVGGGGTVCPVFFDGTSWVAH